MPIDKINDINLYWKLTGDKGETLILVHGSWGDHHNWDAVVGELSKSFRVLTYDRRGYSQSEKPFPKSGFKNEVWDLIRLIEFLHISGAHIVGNLFGASIVMKTATQRPDLFKTMIVNDPPLFGLLNEEQNAPIALEAFDYRIKSIMDLYQNKKIEAAAFQYVDTIGIGPGAWEKLSESMRHIFIANAESWYNQMTDPEIIDFDFNQISNFKKPTLLSNGDLSPLIYHKVVDKLENIIAHSKRITYQGSAHVPHISNPKKFVEAIRNFCIG